MRDRIKRITNYEVKERIASIFSSTDELFQSTNRNFFLVDTLYFVDRLERFQIFNGINQRKREKNLRKNQVRYKEILLFQSTN